jgi:hypothetical protein
MAEVEFHLVRNPKAEFHLVGNWNPLGEVFVPRYQCPTSTSHRPYIDPSSRLSILQYISSVDKTTRYTRMYRCKCHLRVRKTWCGCLWLQMYFSCHFYMGRPGTNQNGENVYICILIIFCSGFHERRMYTQPSGLNEPYVLICSCRMSLWVGALSRHAHALKSSCRGSGMKWGSGMVS